MVRLAGALAVVAVVALAPATPVAAHPLGNCTVNRYARVGVSAGVTLAAEGPDSERASARREAIAALLGYVTGFGVGAVYGVLRPRALRGVPRSVAGVGVAAVATATTVAPYGALGVSDPGTRPAKSWAADIIPHLCYGWATAAAFDALHAAAGKGQGREC